MCLSYPGTLRGPPTPPFLVFLTAWTLDPIALGGIVVAGALYLVGVSRVRRSGGRWPWRRTLTFLLAGLGMFAWVSFGFLGAYSDELRWAFTTRIALLLFVVPALLALGHPIELARSTLRGRLGRLVEWVLRSRLVRLLENPLFAPLIVLGSFLVFITPLALPLRQSVASEYLITLVVPLVGLVMATPFVDRGHVNTGLMITVEFLLSFAELLSDAIPGILLRLNNTVLDHGAALSGALPGWFPSPLQDQHFSGDFLWFIAEITDIPLLIIFFFRWLRSDAREAKKFDELSDEEVERLTQEHLHHHPE